MSDVLVVTDTDRDMARDAIAEGYGGCKYASPFFIDRCSCDGSVIDGCKSRVEAIAKAIATARKI